MIKSYLWEFVNEPRPSVKSFCQYYGWTQKIRYVIKNIFIFIYFYFVAFLGYSYIGKRINRILRRVKCTRWYCLGANVNVGFIENKRIFNDKWTV